MRSEAVWLVQFVVTITIVAAAFSCGMWAGWRRWGRPGPATWDTLDAQIEVRTRAAGRRDLFAPEVDLRAHHDDAMPRQLTRGS
jgi:hypothetical protein